LNNTETTSKEVVSVGTAKEYHGMDYTQYIGKAPLQIELIFGCFNLKKLAKMKQRMRLIGSFSWLLLLLKKVT